jgi:hypothetical protein
MDDAGYRGWLASQPIEQSTARDQISRVRRIEAAFGDLDARFDQDAMASVIAALTYGSQDAAQGRPPPVGLSFDGDVVVGMRNLLHAARRYLAFCEGGVRPTTLDPSRFHSLRPPRPAPTRKLPPTGFWIFQANPARWNADAWVGEAETSVLYLVSRDDVAHMHVGDLGVIRRTVGHGRRASVIAFVEVMEPPRERSERDHRFFRNPTDAAPAPRARLEVLMYPAPAIAVDDLPTSPDLQHVRDGLQRTTTPLTALGFQQLAQLCGLAPLDVAGIRGARSLAGTRALEDLARLDPTRRSVVSKRIERGPIGEAVKVKLGGRCQVCDAFGRSAVAFHKLNGQAFSEAHHVVPVATLRAGSLAAANVMVLCPNHHRQAHHGAFEVLSDLADHWMVSVDGHVVRIDKTRL